MTLKMICRFGVDKSRPIKCPTAPQVLTPTKQQTNEIRQYTKDTTMRVYWVIQTSLRQTWRPAKLLGLSLAPARLL